MLAAVAVAPGRLTGPGAATVTWLGSDPAGRLLTGLVQVTFVLAAAGAVAAALRHRRFRLLAGLAAGAATAGAALAGIVYLAGDRHPHAVTAAAGSLVAGQRGVSRPAPAGRGGRGHRGRIAVAEPSLVPDSLDHAGGRERGPADHRHGPRRPNWCSRSPSG